MLQKVRRGRSQHAIEWAEKSGWETSAAETMHVLILRAR